VLALVLAASGFVAVGVVTCRERNHWAAQLTQLHTDSVDLPQAFRTNFLKLNVQRLLYALSASATDQADVVKQADAVSKILKELDTPQLVPESRDILRQFGSEFEVFRKDLDGLLASSARVSAPLLQIEFRERIQREADRILELDKRLGRSNSAPWTGS